MEVYSLGVLHHCSEEGFTFEYDLFVSAYINCLQETVDFHTDDADGDDCEEAFFHINSGPE